MQILRYVINVAILCGTFCGLAAVASVESSGAPKDAHYFVLVTSGTWSENDVGIASTPIYYPGYDVCKRSWNVFHDAARKAFGAYIEAHYDDSFAYTHNMQTVSNKLHSTTEGLKTVEQANQRLIEWIADEKKQGHSVRVHRDFSFTYKNL